MADNRKITRHWCREQQQYKYYIHRKVNGYSGNPQEQNPCYFHQEVTSEKFRKLIFEEIARREGQMKKGGGYHDQETYHFFIYGLLVGREKFDFVLLPKTKKQKMNSIKRSFHLYY